jgi:phage N-6-adenine-methyltransferase
VEKNTGEYEWYTPPGVIAAARRVMGGIDLDPASNEIAQRTVQAARYYTRETDGLAQPWGGRVWMNPPYASDLIDKFIAKLVEEIDAGHIEAAIVLVDNKTDTRWFHLAAGASSRICFTRGRIGFLRPDGSPGAPTNGSALFYFGEEPDAFAREFGSTGLVVRRHA